MKTSNHTQGIANRAAAVFDLDGTLLPGTSAEIAFLRFALATGELKWMDFARGLARWLARVPRRGVAQNKAHFAGFPRRRLTDLGRVFVETWLIDRIPEEAVHAIDVHRRRGEVVGIVSGAPEDLIRELAEPLGLDFVVGTDLDTREGILTGHVARGHISGETKVETAHKLARHFDFDLSRSSAYGNAYADRFLLSRVSRPVAVNPDERLRKLAESQGWPVLSYGGAS